MKKNFILKIVVNLLYILLWFIPIYFFVRDFFFVEDIQKVMEKGILEVIFFSVKQGLYSTIMALLAAIIPAYYSVYSGGIFSKMVEGLIFIPFFFPVISTITVFSIIFNLPFIKELNILYTLKAIVIANVFYNSPIFIKYIGEGLRKIPREIEEAMKLDGASEVKIFLKGQLPLILPQLFRAFILVFTYCFLGFGIVLSLGGIKFSTIEVEIANTLMGGADFSKAMVLGGIQFIILLILNLTGTTIREYEVSGENTKKNVNIFFKIYSYFYILFQYGIVFLAFLFSFINIFTGKFSLAGYRNLFAKDFREEFQIISGLINSLGISIVVSFFAIIIVYIIIKNYTRLTDVIIFSNLGISGAFLGITLYYLNVLFNFPLIILLGIGYILGVIPVGYAFIYQYVKKFPKDILENAQLDCKNRFQRFIFVEYPMLKNIFLSAFLQIFAIVFGEFTMSYTLQLGDIIPVASLVNYSLVSEKKYMESSAFTTIILLIVLIAFISGEYFKEKKR